MKDQFKTTYGSVCSGIEAASVAWEPLGFSPLWFSEIEAAPSAILKHHWPAVPNLGDMLALPALIASKLAPAPAVLVGGTPCQSFSVAGARQGMKDARGQLTTTYVEVLNEIDKQRGQGNEAACVWENVPGVLSSADNAFGCFVGLLSGSDAALYPEPQPPAGKSSQWWRWNKKAEKHWPRWPYAGCVYGPQRTTAWRTLDAQYFGVAQRRRRVFVVSSARNGFDPCAVLFERESGRRDSPPRRETRERVASAITAGSRKCDRGDGADNLTPCFWNGEQVTQTLDAVLHKGQTMPEKNRFPAVLQEVSGVHGPTSHTLRGEGFDGSEDGTGRGTPVVGSYSLAVRRLMPVECERLQGFPDNHTNVPDWYQCRCGCCFEEHLGKYGCPDCCGVFPARLKKVSDSARYKAIGNSKAVPCAAWIGLRLQKELKK